jgi:hypothetical protein
VILDSAAPVHGNCTCLYTVTTWYLARHLNGCISIIHAWSAWCQNWWSGPGDGGCRHGMIPPSLRRDDEPSPLCSVFSTAPLAGVQARAREWSYQLSCNLQSCCISVLFYRSTTALLCVPVGRSMEHEKQNISDLTWSGTIFIRSSSFY